MRYIVAIIITLILTLAAFALVAVNDASQNAHEVTQRAQTQQAETSEDYRALVREMMRGYRDLAMATIERDKPRVAPWVVVVFVVAVGFGGAWLHRGNQEHKREIARLLLECARSQERLERGEWRHTMALEVRQDSEVVRR